MDVLSQIRQALVSILESFFGSDLDVMSPEAKRIFSNSEDKRKYIEAIEKLKNSDTNEETITLSNNETITLVS